MKNAKQLKKSKVNVPSIKSNFSFVDEKWLSQPKKLLNTFNNFIENGGDINSKDKDGRTILHAIASLEGYHSQMFELIKNDADVTITDNNNQSPLHFAVNNGIFKNTEVLLNCSANVNDIDKDGNTPLDLLPGAKVKYKMIYGKDLENREDWIRPEVVVQFVPCGENVSKVYGNVLDSGENNFNWIHDSNGTDSIVHEAVSPGHEENKLKLQPPYSPDRNYMVNSEPFNTINHYKVNFAMYLLSWGAVSKQKTLNSLSEVKKSFRPRKDKYDKEYSFSFSSIKSLSKKLAASRLLNLKKQLNKKGIPVNISNINYQLPISDKISFLSMIHFQNEFLTKEQLNCAPSQTYLKRKRSDSPNSLNARKIPTFSMDTVAKKEISLGI